MGPIVKQLTGDYADQSIRFVTFDFTNDETTAAAKAAAAEMGVAGLYSKHAPNTGFLLLYDTKKQEVVRKLVADDNDAKWRAAIDKGLGG